VTPLFKHVGHYNSPETENDNNFAYRTPAAFISIDRVDWTATKFDHPGQDLSREQDGLATFTIHIFLHDLRTDTDSYPEHLTTINRVYRALIGLRSPSTVEGKYSSFRRVREVDDIIFSNLRHWKQTYESFVQEAPISAERVDASPATLEVTIEVINPNP
ncbi:MAG: hypothetical protein KAS70_08120, partial [Planctomycetes bacterium]|nr:hypothetical protein [Planctomycetota bacterium]